MIRKTLLALCITLTLLSCGPKKEKKIKFKPIEDMRKEASVPQEIIYGIEFTYLDKKAKSISIIGDFNNWNDNRNYMRKNKYGLWSIILPLEKGTYSYKYNVDGVYIFDPLNPEKVRDNMGDIRSIVEVKIGKEGIMKTAFGQSTIAQSPKIVRGGVFFSYLNKTAKSVTVGGDFNNWNKYQYFMEKNLNGIWSVIVPLEKGEFLYKFCIDGLWINDPENKNTRPDDMGSLVSYLKIEHPVKYTPTGPEVIAYDIVRFSYKSEILSHTDTIKLIGSFNKWNPDKHYLTDLDKDGEWITCLKLYPGKYFYRYIISDEEHIDYWNDQLEKAPDGRDASIKEVYDIKNHLNVKFLYIDSEASRVSIIGEFNNWDLDKLNKDEEGNWFIVKKLLPGQYPYKFVVDNKYKLDIYNPNTISDANGEMFSYLLVH